MSQRAFWIVTALASLACSGAGGDDFFKTDATDSNETGATTTGGLITTSTPTATNSTTDGSTSTDSGGTSTTSGSTTTQGGTSAQGTGGAPSDSTSAGGSGGNTASGGETASGGNGGSGASGGNPSSGGAPASGGSAGNTGTGGNLGTGGNGGSCMATDEICDGLDNDCNDEIDEGDACPDACTGVSFEGHGYMFCVEPGNSNATRDWEWTLNFCADHGETLVRVETAAENEFIYEQLNEMSGSGSAWMAGTDQRDEDLWVWASTADADSWQPFYDADEGQPIDDAFVDWSPGEPDNSPGANGGADCAAFENLGDGEWGWADRPCGASYDRVICESTD